MGPLRAGDGVLPEGSSTPAARPRAPLPSPPPPTFRPRLDEDVPSVPAPTLQETAPLLRGRWASPPGIAPQAWPSAAVTGLPAKGPDAPGTGTARAPSASGDLVSGPPAPIAVQPQGLGGERVATGRRSEGRGTRRSHAGRLLTPACRHRRPLGSRPLLSCQGLSAHGGAGHA